MVIRLDHGALAVALASAILLAGCTGAGGSGGSARSDSGDDPPGGGDVQSAGSATRLDAAPETFHGDRQPARPGPTEPSARAGRGMDAGLGRDGMHGCDVETHGHDDLSLCDVRLLMSADGTWRVAAINESVPMAWRDLWVRSSLPMTASSGASGQAVALASNEALPLDMLLEGQVAIGQSFRLCLAGAPGPTFLAVWDERPIGGSVADGVLMASCEPAPAFAWSVAREHRGVWAASAPDPALALCVEVPAEAAPWSGHVEVSFEGSHPMAYDVSARSGSQESSGTSDGAPVPVAATEGPAWVRVVPADAGLVVGRLSLRLEGTSYGPTDGVRATAC